MAMSEVEAVPESSGSVEEKPDYWNWLEKHRNLREIKSRNGSLELEGGPIGLGLSIRAIFRIEH